MKIAFMGVSGSGKDFLARYLIDEHDFIRLSFSDQLKELANHIYPWMEKDYFPEEKTLPINITLSTGESIKHTPRDIWLHLNKLREIEDRIFIRMLSEELINLEERYKENQNIIITDIRSNDEFIWCKNNGFIVIYIERSNNNYEKYDIDKYINLNKTKADYQFINNEYGMGDFKTFIEEVLSSGY
ncbi:adenylate kinase [Salinivibrio sp. YCSC6]|uniref:adenylate kinase n=1 Tax=Salinivibrio sp. YCSC6 TaxID=2003370 RepID=UPI000BBC7E98|nr:adenylate kinase [Salinivibrio sp. YCSC6]PCE68815.1 adenylate kinase [Salinivibrio sp. YCSC6]QCF36753.1 AAA family ATPase [Salinivibrio sp. YCSC6]